MYTRTSQSAPKPILPLPYVYRITTILKNVRTQHWVDTKVFHIWEADGEGGFSRRYRGPQNVDCPRDSLGWNRSHPSLYFWFHSLTLTLSLPPPQPDEARPSSSVRPFPHRFTRQDRYRNFARARQELTNSRWSNVPVSTVAVETVWTTDCRKESTSSQHHVHVVQGRGSSHSRHTQSCFRKMIFFSFVPPPSFFLFFCFV